VYSAEHVVTKQKYALKVPLAKKSNMAIREAYFLGLMKSEHVVSMKEAIVEKGRLVIVMEHCGCGDLSTLIEYMGKNHKPTVDAGGGKVEKVEMEESCIIEIMVQIALGLRHMHRFNIAHRDIKAANILITDAGILKLADLGTCRMMVDMSTTFVGTPMYMSPEIWHHKPYSLSTDVFSLGLTIYELCVLEPTTPFIKDGFGGKKVFTQDLLPAKYSKELQDLLGSMLSHDPQQRPNVHDLFSNPLIVRGVKNLYDKNVEFLRQRRQTASQTVQPNQHQKIGDYTMTRSASLERNILSSGTSLRVPVSPLGSGIK